MTSPITQSPVNLEVLTNPQRLEYCVDSMARFLAQVLTLKDPDLSAPVPVPNINLAKRILTRPHVAQIQREYWKREEQSKAQVRPFGLLLFSELSIKATPRQEIRLGQLYDLDAFTTTTIRLCNSMLEESDVDYKGDFFLSIQDGDELPDVFLENEWKYNIDLFFYAYSIPNSPFFMEYYYESCSGTKIQLGGFSHRLFKELKELTSVWIRKCDRVFCSANGIECVYEEKLQVYYEAIATAIARRHSLMRHPQDEFDMEHADSSLQIPTLDFTAANQFWQNHFDAMDQRRADTEALSSLLVLAKFGGTSIEAQTVILKHTNHLEHAINTSPQELGLHDDTRARKFNFSALAPILVKNGMENPFRCRCQCAQQWHESCGEWAAVEIQEAIDRINRPDFKANIGYLDVVGNEHRPGSIALPSNPCAFESLRWFAHNPDYRKRSNLTDFGLRAVCMVTFLKNRLMANTMKYGTVDRQILENEANDHLRKASYTKCIIESDRMRTNQGVSLLLFERNIKDTGSDLNACLDKPLCALSGISYAEIDAVFGNFKHLDLIAHKLSIKTHQLLTEGIVSKQYTEIGADALGLILSCIKIRRESHGVRSFMRTNAWADLLRCIPKVRVWFHSVQTFGHSSEFVSLCLQDVVHSNPALVERIQQQIESKSSLVFMGSKGHQKRQFVFCARRLYSLLCL